MISRTAFIALAAVTLVLMAISAAIREDNASVGLIGDIIWLAFLACAFTLIVLTVGVLARGPLRSSRRPSSRA